MGTRVDLQQLRKRLEHLGVHLDLPDSPRSGDGSDAGGADSGTASGEAGVSQTQQQQQHQHQVNRSWSKAEAQGHAPRAKISGKRGAAAPCSRVEELLARCDRVEAALSAHPAVGPSNSHINGGGGEYKEAAVVAGEAEGGETLADAWAADEPLGDLQQQLQQQQQRGRSIGSTGGGRLAGRSSSGGGGGLGSSVRVSAPQVAAGSRRSSTFAGARAAAVADLNTTVALVAGTGVSRGTPLGVLLAQWKDAQAAWAAEKAKLRREAAEATKKAGKIELELKRLERVAAGRAADVASLRAALKGRDVALGEALARAKAAEDALTSAHDVAHAKLTALAAERDDLQGLLLATLERLEAVEGAAAAADRSGDALEEKVRCLEEERTAALQSAEAARAEVAALSEARRRLEWQGQLLDKMSEVQLRHSRRKAAAIKELLADAGRADAVAAADVSSPKVRQSRRQQQPGADEDDALDMLRAVGLGGGDGRGATGVGGGADDDDGASHGMDDEVSMLLARIGAVLHR